MKEKLIKISNININKELYPRANVNFYTIARYINALKAGSVFPPITVAKLKGKFWLVDGMHRIEANKGCKNKHISAEVINVADEKQLYVESVKRNITHGMQFNTYEVTKIIVKLGDFKLTPVEISQMVGITVDKLEPFVAKRMTLIIGSKDDEQTVLKKPLAYLSENETGITLGEIEFQRNLSGNSQENMVLELIDLINNNLVNPEVNKKLIVLYHLLKDMFENQELVKKAAKEKKIADKKLAKAKTKKSPIQK